MNKFLAGDNQKTTCLVQSVAYRVLKAGGKPKLTSVFIALPYGHGGYQFISLSCR